MLAFLATYAASGVALQWSAFFTADFARAEYIRDRFFSDFAFTPELAVAVFAGIAVCVLTAMIRAPFYRAIAGPRYPLAPRRWEEAGRLMLFYLLLYVVLWVAPLAVPSEGIIASLVTTLSWIVMILVIFADYVIVFEDIGLMPALRRSLNLLGRRWPAVLIIFIILQLVYIGLYALYDLYYGSAARVFILLPISQILVESFVVLVAELVLIFLYEQIRRHSPS